MFGLLLTILGTRSAYVIGLYITAAHWFAASTSFRPSGRRSCTLAVSKMMLGVFASDTRQRQPI
jgi:hypothetical protein